MGERVQIKTKTPESTGKLPVSKTQKRVFPKTKSSPANQIIYLQRTIGNRELQRLLKSGAIQAKLTIGKPNDKYEQEADRVADKVMSMSEPGGSLVNSQWSLGKREKESSLVQRQATCPECPEKEEIQTKPLADQITPLVQRQVGPEEEEEPVHPKLQRQTEEEEEEPVQAKQASNQTSAVISNIESSVNSLKGGGQPLPKSSRSYFESRFGVDFSHVRVHTDGNAADIARSVNAKAFTAGRDVVFGTGQFSSETLSGKRLLSHELAHVVQQSQKTVKVQRQWIPDTGWRYKPPKTVKRSIIEIQGIVGTKPDGIYGPNTREFVKKYQRKLNSVGLYTKKINGKWDTYTDVAHVAFAIDSFYDRITYNCAGFAFKTYQPHNKKTTKVILSDPVEPLADCSRPCEKESPKGSMKITPYYHKFWYWEFDISETNTSTGVTTEPEEPRDFHVVGGQTDKDGKGPNQVMSKDGVRPVEGPKPPLQWRPITEPAKDAYGNEEPNKRWNISNLIEKCYCSKRLPKRGT